MQRWRRLGHVYVAGGEHELLATHATYPVALPMPDGRARVFFSPRDARNRSSIFSLDLALHPDGRFERLGPPRGPWLEPGERGAFDDGGASVSCVVPRADGGVDCWYLGWNPGSTVPFRTAAGLAEAGPGEERFRRASRAPTLDRSAEDPLVVGYPWILREGGGRLVAWYGTHLRWGPEGLQMEHAIRRAVSPDGGRSWARDPEPCLLHAGGEEFALSRPCVLREPAGYAAWYCRRFARYRLGFAWSEDGRAWTRNDAELRLEGPEGAWEAGEQTYPCVFDHAGRRWMLYNGAGYGRSGFGLAVLEA